MTAPFKLDSHFHGSSVLSVTVSHAKSLDATMLNWRILSLSDADQICVAVIFIDRMGHCNYPIAMALPVNQLSCSPVASKPLKTEC